MAPQFNRDSNIGAGESCKEDTPANPNHRGDDTSSSPRNPRLPLEVERSPFSRYFRQPPPPSSSTAEATNLTDHSRHPRPRSDDGHPTLYRQSTDGAQTLSYRQQQKPPQPRTAEVPPVEVESAYSKLERGRAVDAFLNAFVDRMSDAASHGRHARAWGNGGGFLGWFTTAPSPSEPRSSPSPGLAYATERAVVQTHLNPLIFGGASAVVTLVSLRLGRWHRQSGGKSILTNWPFSRRTLGTMEGEGRSQVQPSRRHRFDHPLARDEVVRDSKLKQELGTMLTLPVDFALSLLFASSAAMFLTDQPQILEDFGAIPLVSGRSFVSEELCGPFTRDFENYPDDFWTEENAGEFKSLLAVREFVQNCQRRGDVEREIRKQKGGGGVSSWMEDESDDDSVQEKYRITNDVVESGEDESVLIPKPGIQR